MLPTICWQYFKLNLIRTLTFRTPLYIEVAAGSAYLVAMLTFWKVLYARVGQIAGWTAGEMLLFMFFIELFWGISRGLFGVSRYFWTAIHEGQIDKYLCRPLDARVGLILHTMNLPVLVRSLALSTIWLWAALHTGLFVALAPLLAGVAAMLLGVMVYVEFALTINYLAFGWGDTSALDELLGGFWELLRYPLNLLPALLRRLLTAVIPAALTATVPTLISVGELSAPGGVLMSCAIWVVWHGIQEYAWRRGLQHYESSRG